MTVAGVLANHNTFGIASDYGGCGGFPEENGPMTKRWGILDHRTDLAESERTDPEEVGRKTLWVASETE